jgi:hypothetical protein
MYQFESDVTKGTFILYDNFDVIDPNAINAAPTFSTIGQQYILSFPNLENVSKLTKFYCDSLGLTDTRYVYQFYRISRDLQNWTDWLPLNRNIDNFPVVDPKDPLHLEIKWERLGTSTIGIVKLLSYRIEGLIDRQIVEDGSIFSVNKGGMQIMRSPFIFKVFSVTDIEIISPSHPNGLPAGVSIKWRYSQDSTRSWSNWEFFTKQNVTTKRINPIRFFQVEYMIENNSNEIVTIQDINLIGDFQNVNGDYTKTNLFGIRECCQSNLNGTYDSNGNFIPNSNLNSAGGPACETNIFKPMDDEEKANLYNPYSQNTAMNLLQKLSNDAQQMFGHKVIYFATDPDKKGQDHILNEYQLYNVVCQGEVKVSVEGNNFPDSQIVMNQFDLNLFETMEVHITKQQFKEVFGIHRRPAKEDFLYFCNLNRMYSVDHAQQFRNFNNAAVYYKLVLKKYNKSANLDVSTVDIKNQIDKLTKNTTIDELMGVEQQQEKSSIANKPQMAPLTRDTLRLEILADIDKELIENSSTIISKSHYDLSSVEFGTPAVKYVNLDPTLRVSDNLSYQIWFFLNNYIPDEVYSFFDFYDTTLNQGWKSELKNDLITVTINNQIFNFDLNTMAETNNDSNLDGIPDQFKLDEFNWYCYVLNIDQRNGEIEQFIYQRYQELNDDDIIKGDIGNNPKFKPFGSNQNTFLDPIYRKKLPMNPVEFNVNINPVIKGSDMRVTNIRLFSDILPVPIHNKILNQYIIGEDSKYLIFADNATTRLYLPKFPLFE